VNIAGETAVRAVQVAVDCADPHALVRFWASATGMEVEDHHDQVTEMVGAGFASGAETVEIDGRRAWATAAACRDPDGRLPRLLFQQVPEGKTVKNRWHLDLDVGPDRCDAEVERLIDLGATRLWDGRQGPHTWVTLADPEGNEFCVG
jgi:hypothetical protein